MEESQFRERVDDAIDELLNTHVFGKNFSFRAGQREAVTNICLEYLRDPYQTIVLDAPTGTGKSIVAMACSRILTGFEATGYLVTSDLMLQEQYEADFQKFKLPWASVKGVDNYDCVVNGYKFSLGECRIRGMGYEKAKRLPCASRCGYLVNREKSIHSKVALLNYSYWLIQRNYVERQMKDRAQEVPFKQRDFGFFDEAHKIDEIVQNHFTPRIHKSLPGKISWFQDFLDRNDFDNPDVSLDIVKINTDRIFDTTDKEELFEILEYFRYAIRKFVQIGDLVKDSAEELFSIDSGDEVPKEWRSAFKIHDYFKDLHCKIDDYNDIIHEIGLKGLIKNPKDEEVQFQCLDERYMIRSFFHKKAKFKVLMSATIGDPQKYARIMAITKGKVIRLDNGFTYEKSPIIYVDRHKLSYKEREANLPKVVTLLDKIIDQKHKGDPGIIHTGSYAFMHYILKNSKHKDRLLAYDDTDKKRVAIAKFKMKGDKILIGPSILEGLDLKDNVSRFQIFFKVPFPSLSDPLIKAKLNYSQDWYNWKTAISVMQGAGRSVRNKDDWAVTYLLDGCFGNLLKKNGLFPDNFKRRLKTIN